MTSDEIVKRILVGDDQIDFAREIFPPMPHGIGVDFVDSPQTCIEKGRTLDYSTVVTDLNYTPGGEEGYKVLEALRDVDARKFLWTGNAYDMGVRERGKSLGAEVLDKDEIGTIVGQVASKAPLKQGGKVLVYVSLDFDENRDSLNRTVEEAIKKAVADEFGKYTLDVSVVSKDLRYYLRTGEYGLAIDTSTIRANGRRNPCGVVTHDMKYVRLAEVPKVVPVYDTSTMLTDIVKTAKDYLKK